ncbi:hypothetical protein [Pseudomonas fluorescens]|uniref:hypothetical protein n=1 Tax=Pseudomonas fluorescens TaxID=294 RepID=UPI00125744C1|nr:hypothetical protein [Pseudomonas fluorescens]VVN23111.1 hypothetical protein PS639_04394 [Pseudomonas fluorescens]
MADVLKPPVNMAIALETRALPSITRWERVEGIPRAHDLARALRAEVRDPLWMLARQWQLGEFIGDDAGSPVFAKLHIKTTQLTTYAPREGPEQSFDDSMPLESRVEQRPIAFTAGTQRLSLDLRLLMGRQWLKLLVRAALPFEPGFRAVFAVEASNPASPNSAAVCAHPEAWQHEAAFAGRAMDGYLWYQWLVANPSPRNFSTLPAPLVITAVDAGTVDMLGDRFIAWFDQLIDQPLKPEENAWDPSRLEYRFQCSAPLADGRKEFAAEEYYLGDLDWYALDVAPVTNVQAQRPDVQSEIIQTFIPTSVEFSGMANPRWWTFEDRRINFGAIKPDTTDIAKLLMLEFGLVYSNDWCIVPVQLPAGTVADVAGLAVTNVFGERLWIEPAGQTPEQVWQRWSMFTQYQIAPEESRKPSTSLLMLPTVPKIQEGEPLEKVFIVRDEMANMVWGIEDTIPLPHGVGRSGHGAAAETLRFFERLLGGPPLAPLLVNNAKVRYEVMNTVPENWIPFIPVHVPGDNRQIQLQRASLPRRIQNQVGPGDKIKPRTSLLREGLDRLSQEAYFVHEEEVPRSGVQVTQAFQRTRWTNGRVVIWFGAYKRVGRGEGSSGLQFDRLVPVPKKS